MEKRHLPRLAPEFYRGHAFVHWTLTTERRATGWLTAACFCEWQRILVHTCARWTLACPAYVLMPDHVHLLVCGMGAASDQRLAVEFLRRHTAPALAPCDWQHQAHDHVLRESEREAGAFQAIAAYVLANPARAGLAHDWTRWPYAGCCVSGYPDLDPRRGGYWELFWRIYARLAGGGHATRSRS